MTPSPALRIAHNVEPHSASAEWSSLPPLLSRLPSPRIEPNHAWCSRTRSAPSKMGANYFKKPYYGMTNESLPLCLILYLPLVFLSALQKNRHTVCYCLCQLRKLGTRYNRPIQSHAVHTSFVNSVWFCDENKALQPLLPTVKMRIHDMISGLLMRWKCCFAALISPAV